jgi:hypothetical protein
MRSRLRRRMAVRSVLSGGDGSDLSSRAGSEGHRGHRLQFEGVISRRDHSQRHSAIRGAVEIFGFKPCAEPGIVDLRLPLPEVGFKAALNAEMAELEFDVARVFRKVAAGIRGSNVQPGDAVAFALSFNDHRVPVLRFPLEYRD